MGLECELGICYFLKAPLATKLLEENLYREKVHDTALGSNFLAITQHAPATEETMVDFRKMKNLVHQRTLEQSEIQATRRMGKNICIAYV